MKTNKEIGRCPNCGSEIEDFTNWEVDSGYCYLGWRCWTCGKEGQEKHRMVFVQNIILGE